MNDKNENVIIASHTEFEGICSIDVYNGDHLITFKINPKKDQHTMTIQKENSDDDYHIFEMSKERIIGHLLIYSMMTDVVKYRDRANHFIVTIVS